MSSKWNYLENLTLYSTKRYQKLPKGTSAEGTRRYQKVPEGTRRYQTFTLPVPNRSLVDILVNMFFHEFSFQIFGRETVTRFEKKNTNPKIMRHELNGRLSGRGAT
jgi:hypothetical protein